jgi:hypothetical protein
MRTSLWSGRRPRFRIRSQSAIAGLRRFTQGSDFGLNLGEHHGELFKDLLGLDSQDSIPGPAERFVPTLIGMATAIMARSIDFDGEAHLGHQEIEDVLADGHLAANLDAEGSAPQGIP